MLAIHSVRTDLKITDKERELIDIARQKTKQSRNMFVTKSAIDRAKQVLQEKQGTQ